VTLYTSVRTVREMPRGRYKAMLRRDPCSYCFGEGGTVEHLVPRAEARGLLENIVGACARCNSSRHGVGVLTMLLRGAR
jgi:5-methylcytosine-specific restriction endonuclease McrA